MNAPPMNSHAETISAALADLDRNGFAIVKNLFTDEHMDELTTAMEALQARVASGDLDPWFAGNEFVADFDGPMPPFVHYVVNVEELSPEAHAAFYDPLVMEIIGRALGPDHWLFRPDDRTVVFQDARPGQGMTYSRIGWHTDHQSRPTSDIWPAIAVTVHLDATSPANGFLRVLPGSHRMTTDTMPLGFEKVPGEIGLYCDRGDVLLHHSDLWHSAARATEDAPSGIRRHLRGSFMGGREPGPGELEPFNKNAMR